MNYAARELFRRCVQCPAITPACPSCASDETCTLIAGSCTSCASTVCTKVSSGSNKHSTPAGAIAGGVIGGVVVIALIVYCFWRFFIRERRKEWDEQVWSDKIRDAVEKRDQVGTNRDARQSVRSVHSIASTVLTRASNVIQIAYIPGVTNRSPPETPGLLVPPVPPLPLATVNSNATSPAFEQDQHFFLPGDIRDSTWSGYSDMSRASISPSLARTSVATTIYRNNAIVSPMPAQQAMRGKAAVVSVKSGATTPTDTPTTATTPPMPVNAISLINSKSTIVARNMVAKPIQVKKSSSNNSVPTLGNLKAKSTKPINTFAQTRLDSSSEETTEDDLSPSSPQQKLMKSRSGRRSDATTVIDDSPVEGSSSSTARESSTGASHRHKKSGSLHSLIEDAMNRTKDSKQGGLGSITEKKDGGPFSDANEVKETL